MVYNEPYISLEELVNLDRGISIHSKHINTLLTAIYKTFQVAILMKNIFMERDLNVQFKNIKPLKLYSKEMQKSFVFTL